MKFMWIEHAVVEAVHDEQLAEHGGLAGVRDAGMFASALARPLNLVAHGDPDVADCAAAYAYGIARNHPRHRPSVDGNKRTAFVAMQLFLALNGRVLEAGDAECVMVMLGVADGSIVEEAFAAWIRSRLIKRAR